MPDNPRSNVRLRSTGSQRVQTPPCPDDYAQSWIAACDAYVDDALNQPVHIFRRGPIRRPPTNPAPMPPLPNEDVFFVDGEPMPAEWLDYQHAEAEWLRIQALAQPALDRAWQAYWSDIIERVRWLFAPLAMPRDPCRVVERIDQALARGRSGEMPAFVLSVPSAKKGVEHRRMAHAELFAMIEQEIAAQTKRDVRAACRAVVKVASKRQPDLLRYGSKNATLKPESLRQAYERKQGKWTPHDEARAIEFGGRAAIRCDLLRAAGIAPELAWMIDRRGD